MTCTPLARVCIIPYGEAENVHTTATCLLLKVNTLRPIVIVSNRKCHLEVYILSFGGENLLSLSIVIKLIKFFQFLSRDPNVLSQLQMNLTDASYKLKHGLSAYVCKRSS